MTFYEMVGNRSTLTIVVKNSLLFNDAHVEALRSTFELFTRSEVRVIDSGQLDLGKKLAEEQFRKYSFFQLIILSDTQAGYSVSRFDGSAPSLDIGQLSQAVAGNVTLSGSPKVLLFVSALSDPGVYDEELAFKDVNYSHAQGEPNQYLPNKKLCGNVKFFRDIFVAKIMTGQSSPSRFIQELCQSVNDSSPSDPYEEIFTKAINRSKPAKWQYLNRLRKKVLLLSDKPSDYTCSRCRKHFNGDFRHLLCKMCVDFYICHDCSKTHQHHHEMFTLGQAVEDTLETATDAFPQLRNPDDAHVDSLTEAHPEVLELDRVATELKGQIEAQTLQVKASTSDLLQPSRLPSEPKIDTEAPQVVLIHSGSVQMKAKESTKGQVEQVPTQQEILDAPKPTKTSKEVSLKESNVHLQPRCFKSRYSRSKITVTPLINDLQDVAWPFPMTLSLPTVDVELRSGSAYREKTKLVVRDSADFAISQAEVLEVSLEFKYPEIMKVNQGGTHDLTFIPDVAKSWLDFEKEVKQRDIKEDPSSLKTHYESLHKIRSTLLKAKVKNTFVITRFEPFAVLIISLPLRAVVQIKGGTKDSELQTSHHLISSIPFPALEDWKWVEVNSSNATLDQRLWKEIIGSLSQDSRLEASSIYIPQSHGETRSKATASQEEMATYLALLKFFLFEEFPKPTQVQALHVASALGSLDLVREVLILGSKVEEKDLVLESLPLHLASAFGHIDIVKFLIDRDANVNAKDDHNKTPLHYASENGHLELVKYLAQHQACIDDKDDQGRTPLHFAAAKGHAEVAKALITFGAKLDNEDQTPLHFASEKGHLEIINILLDNKADVNAPNKKGKTALHLASLTGHLDTVEALLKHGANESAQDKKSKTSLHFAAANGHPKIVMILLNSKANIIARDYKLKIPLHYASENGCHAVVQILLRNRDDFNVPDNEGKTPLHFASENGHLDVVKSLLHRGANVNAPGKQHKTPLHFASENGHLDIVEILVNHGAKIQDWDFDNKAPLHLASENGHLGVVKFLLEKEARAITWNKNVKTPLHLAAANCHLEIVQTLMNYKANVNAKSSDGKTPLHLASENGDADIVSILVAYDANIAAQETNGKAPLHHASANGHLAVVQFLIKKQADVNLKDNAGCSSLDYASEYGHSDIAKVLLFHGANFENAEKNPLHYASERGHLEIVNNLLDHRASVDARSKNGKTALHFAAKNGQLEVVKSLADHEADVNAQDHKGNTPLHFASQKGHFDVAEILLDHGTNVNAKNKQGKTPLQFATSKNHMEIVELLLQRGANPEPMDFHGKSSQHIIL